MSNWDPIKPGIPDPAWNDEQPGPGPGGTDNYNSLKNKPKINNVELLGNKMLYELGIASEEDLNTMYQGMLDALDSKQDLLDAGDGVVISPSNVISLLLKTINNQSLIGSGNIDIDSGGIFVATYESTTYNEVKAAIDANKAIIINFPNNNNLICVTYSTYVIGQNIVMSGIYNDGNDISATKLTLTTTNAWSVANLSLQLKLASGLNIKTINNQSILGSGNIDVSVVFNAGTDYPYATMAAALRQGNVLINDGSVNHPVIFFQDDSSESTLYIFVEGGLQGAPSQVCHKWISGEYQEKTEKYIVPTGGRPGQVLTKNSTSIGDYGWADASGGADAVIIDPDNFTMTKAEFEQLFYTDKLIYIKDGYLNHLVTNKHTWDMLPEIVYELSYIEGKNVIKYTWEVTDDIYYRGKDVKSIGVDIAIDKERWYGTYTDENGVTYQVYTKTIYIPALAGAAGATTYPHGITNIKQILSAYGFTTDGFVLNAPRQNVADNISIYQVQKAGGIVIEVGKDRSNKKAYVTLVYAKNN